MRWLLLLISAALALASPRRPLHGSFEFEGEGEWGVETVSTTNSKDTPWIKNGMSMEGMMNSVVDTHSAVRAARTPVLSMAQRGQAAPPLEVRDSEPKAAASTSEPRAEIETPVSSDLKVVDSKTAPANLGTAPVTGVAPTAAAATAAAEPVSALGSSGTASLGTEFLDEPVTAVVAPKTQAQSTAAGSSSPADITVGTAATEEESSLAAEGTVAGASTAKSASKGDAAPSNAGDATAATTKPAVALPLREPPATVPVSAPLSDVATVPVSAPLSDVANPAITMPSSSSAGGGLNVNSISSSINLAKSAVNSNSVAADSSSVLQSKASPTQDAAAPPVANPIKAASASATANEEAPKIPGTPMEPKASTSSTKANAASPIAADPPPKTVASAAAQQSSSSSVPSNVYTDEVQPITKGPATNDDKPKATESKDNSKPAAADNKDNSKPAAADNKDNSKPAAADNKNNNKPAAADNKDNSKPAGTENKDNSKPPTAESSKPLESPATPKPDLLSTASMPSALGFPDPPKKETVQDRSEPIKMDDMNKDQTPEPIKMETMNNEQSPEIPPPPATSTSKEGDATRKAALSSADSTHSCNENSDKILVAVVSSPNHFKARDQIRQTFAIRAAENHVDVKFFVGQLGPETADRDHIETKLALESSVERLTGFTESYHNLTAKALGIMQYTKDHCYKALMKIDDDVYLDINTLTNRVADLGETSNVFAGALIPAGLVEKDPGGKWYSYDQYPHETWPPYMNGPGIFMGKLLVEYIVENKECMQNLRVDDAGIGVCLQGVEGKRIVEWKVNLYSYHLASDAVYISPVNAEELNLLYDSGNRDDVPLQACSSTNQWGCLCWDSPYYTHIETADCWKRMSEGKYKDWIPRAMLHSNLQLAHSRAVESDCDKETGKC